MPAYVERVPGAFRAIVTRLRGRQRRVSQAAGEQTPEMKRMQDALEMHEVGVKLYRQRMRREHPQASPDDIDGMVRAWLAEPPPSGRLRLPSRERDRGAS
jgi:hypothetical protein